MSKIIMILHCWASRHTLGFEDEDLGSSPGWWAASLATYCPSRPGELPKLLSSKPCEWQDAQQCRTVEKTSTYGKGALTVDFWSCWVCCLCVSYCCWRSTISCWWICVGVQILPQSFKEEYIFWTVEEYIFWTVSKKNTYSGRKCARITGWPIS